MIPIRNFKKYVHMGMSLLIALSAHADPTEKTYEEIIRNTSNDTQLDRQFELSKNIYKQEPYQAEYTVSVPYEAQETYYEKVPYEVDEPYTDYESYTESEWVCNNVRRFRRECRDELICGAPLAAIANLDNIETLTRPPAGGGHGGGHGRGDFNPPPRNPPPPPPLPHNPPPHNPPPHRPPPHNPPPHRPPPVNPPPHRPPPSCFPRRVCSDVPYYERECGYQNVIKQRPVTRYRRVTRYRDEERTRTVTRYREETCCCVTKYKDVFDHQNSYSVQVIMPKVFLFGTESEKFKIVLDGSEVSPIFKLVQNNNEIIYGYKIAKQELSGRNVVLNLELAPRFNMENAGPSTISNFHFKTQSGSTYLKFYDEIKVPHLNTKYIYEIKDRNNNVLVQSETWNIGMKDVEILLSKSLPRSEELTLKLHVHREGAMIENYDLDFDMTSTLKLH